MKGAFVQLVKNIIANTRDVFRKNVWNEVVNILMVIKNIGLFHSATTT